MSFVRTTPQLSCSHTGIEAPVRLGEAALRIHRALVTMRTAQKYSGDTKSKTWSLSRLSSTVSWGSFAPCESAFFWMCLCLCESRSKFLVLQHGITVMLRVPGRASIS